MSKKEKNLFDSKQIMDKSQKKEIDQPEKQDLQTSHIVKRSKDQSPVGIPGMVKIDNDRWGEVESNIIQILDRVTEDRQGFLDRLSDYEEAIQGIPEKGRKGPWDNSCELRDTLTGTHCRTIETAMNRTLDIDPPFLATVKGDKPLEKRLTGLANESAKHDFDFSKVMTFVSKAAVRKTAAIIVPEWERKVKRSKDTEYYQTLEAYKEDYPNAKAADLTEAEYKSQLEIVQDDIDKVGHHACLYEYDEVIINRPTVNVVSPEKFYMYPYTAATTDLAQLLGRELYKTYHEAKMAERDGVYKNVDRIAVTASLSDKDSEENSTTIKQENKGIDPQENSFGFRDKIYTFVKGIVRLDLYQDGMERDYEFVMCYEVNTNCKVLVRLAPYAINYNERNFIVANILPEEDTIFGTCIPELLDNPQATLDVLTRLLIDSNSIANVPMFKAHWNDRSNLGNNRNGRKFYPGKVMYSKNPGELDSFKTDRIDATAFLSIMRYIAGQSEMTTGASRTLAGQNLADDPEAPGIKTAMLIQQSNFMVNEYIKNIRPALAKMMVFIIKLYRQHMKIDETKDITVVDHNEQNKTLTITRKDIKFLDQITTFELKNQRVEDSEQSRLISARADLELLIAIPIVGQNPMAVRALVMNYLMSNKRYSMKEIEQIVPTMEQIKGMLQEVASEAVKSEMAQREAQDNMNVNQNITDRQDAEMENKLRP
jgi:hypothetical protein